MQLRMSRNPTVQRPIRTLRLGLRYTLAYSLRRRRLIFHLRIRQTHHLRSRAHSPRSLRLNIQHQHPAVS